MEPSKRARSGSEDGCQVEAAKDESSNESSSGPPASSLAENNPSSPAKPKQITIKLETILADAYVRTRHNNLRCFPKCSPFHMEQRFCGRALEISLDGVPEEMIGKALVFGEFRNKRSSSLLEVGSTCGKDRLSDLSERIMFAELVRRSGDQDRFVIQPPRKWHYLGKLRSVDWHVIQLYVVIAGVVQATFESSAFHVVPIWKSDDKSERDVEMVSNPIAPVADEKRNEEESDDSSSSSSSSSSSNDSDNPDEVLEYKPVHQKQPQQQQQKAKNASNSSTRDAAAAAAALQVAPGKAVNAVTVTPQLSIGISPHLALPSPFRNAMPTGGLNTYGSGVDNNNSIRGGVELPSPAPTLSYMPTQFLGRGATQQVAYHNIFVPTQMMNGQQAPFFQSVVPPAAGGSQAAFPMMGSSPPVVHVPPVGYTFQMPTSAVGSMVSTSQFGFRPSPTTSPNMTFAFPQPYPQQQQQQMSRFVVNGNGVLPNGNRDQSKINQTMLQGGLPGFHYYHPPPD